MAYTALTIETKVHDVTLSSHCIPAYPEYSGSTTFDAAFYTARQASNDALAERTEDTITYTLNVTA